MRALITRTHTSLMSLGVLTALLSFNLIYLLVLRTQGGDLANSIGPFSNQGPLYIGTLAFALVLALTLLLVVLFVIFLALKLIYARYSNRQFYFAGGALVLALLFTALLNAAPFIYVQMGTTAQWLVMITAIIIYLVFVGLAIYEWRKHESNR